MDPGSVIVAPPPRLIVERTERQKVIVGGIPGAPADSAPGIENFTPTSGQTVFTLSALPYPLTVVVNINTVELQNGIDFTVSGSTVTLLSHAGYRLEPTDYVQITYARNLL